MGVKKLFGMKDNKTKKYFALYTLIFFILFFLCFGVYLILYKKTFFRYYDGFDQHYISFMYLGKWGRSILKDIFVNHHFSIPLWNPAIGYGADIPTSLAAYLWDPFNWITLFIPAKYAEIGYAAMIIIKFYACGISYSIFALHRKHPYYSILCGAVIYTFSAVGYVGFYQSFFINPLIIFPLLILGVDILFEKKKPQLYVIMLAISFASYFYFAYMMCILVFFYCIMKICFGEKTDKNIRNILQLFIRFLLFSLLALGISAISLLPSLIVILQTDRISLSHYLPVLFDKSYYSGIVIGWTSFYNMLARDCNIGWGAIAFICVIILFVQKGKWRIKTEFILMTIGLCIPFVGHVMNGMSYTTNRWVWAYDLVVALIVTMMVPELKKVSYYQKLILMISSFLYIIVCRGYFKASGESFDTAALLILLITGLCFIFAKITEQQFRNIIVFLSCVCVVCSSFFVYSSDYYNGFNDNIDAGEAYTLVMNKGGLPLLNEVDISNGTRFDRFGIESIRNATWMYGVSGINFYISVYNNYIDQFHSAVALNTTNASSYLYSGLNRRSELEALLGVNHYFVNAGNMSKPIGFDTIEANLDVNGNELQSYKPLIDNSLFYMFDKKVSYNEFNSLNPIEKQQVLMQACVVDNKKANTTVKNLDIQPSTIKYSLMPMDGVTVNGDTVSVANDGGQLELQFDNQINSELYLYFNTINFKNGESTAYTVSAQGYDGNQKINNLSDTLSGYTWYNHMYGKKIKWLLNLGMTTESANKIIITFNNAGNYSIKDIQLFKRPIESVQRNIKKLRRVAKNVHYTGNRYKCDVEMDKSGTLFASIPYSQGWTAYDNGKKISINRTDTAFMSFDLNRGEHQIELVYRTPGLFVGTITTIIAIAIFVTICMKLKREVEDKRMR
ncbi:YfhO family protein [Sharpea porci]|uniref:YfhO family protein n=1 Tax=Sharpea porci TaxID=2652286 RepID=UPI002A915723|nr:YfhO family protein [Sharpea porci]MDY5279826.1 YfhO family protein [Sharpea porci]